jgi:hypothetical protein
MERLQGFHEKNILFVVDEASGVSEFIFEAIEGCMTSNRARLLIIGNPTRRSGTFFEAFHSEREHWFNLHISALDTPNLALPSGTGEVPGENLGQQGSPEFGEGARPELVEGLVTPEWVDSARKRWGVNNPTYQIRVLGDFPSQSIDTLLSLVTVEAAVQQASTPHPDPTGPDAAANLPDSTRPAQDGAECASDADQPVAAGLARPSGLPSPLGREDQGEGNHNRPPSIQFNPEPRPSSHPEALEGSSDLEMPVRQVPTTIGVDVARFGTDNTVIAIRKGNCITAIQSFNNQDTMATTGRIVDAINKHTPDGVYIDDVGVGGGVVDRLKEQKISNIHGINVGKRASDPEKFVNLRAEYFDYLREQFEANKISIPNDQQLIAQLTGIRYDFTSTGQMRLEGKETLRRRGLPSPDKADAVMLAFSPHDKRPIISVW